MEQSMILSILPAENTALNTKTTEQDMEDCTMNNNELQKIGALNYSKKRMILSIISEVYPELLVIFAAISVFTETLHGRVPNYHLHVYIYFYLLGVGIIIFLSSFIIQFSHKLCQKSSDTISDPDDLSKNRQYFNVVKGYKLGLIASGLAACLSSCLGSISVLRTPLQCSSTSHQAFSVMCTCFIAFQLLYFLIQFGNVNVFHWCHKLVMMHIVATNAAIWFHAALFASSNDWQEAIHVKYNSSLTWGQNAINISMHSLEYDTAHDNQSHHVPKHAVHVTSNCWWRVPEEDSARDILSINLCLRNSSYGNLWWKVSQITYPVEMQFYILCSIFLFSLWESKRSTRNQCFLFQSSQFQYKWFNILCSKGFIFGSIIFIATAVFALLLAVREISFTVVSSFSCVLFGMSICASVLGLMQLHLPFSIVMNPNQNFVDIRLKYGLFFIYIFCTFNVYIGFIVKTLNSFLLSLQSILTIVHAVIQYVLIKHIFNLPDQSESKVRSKQVLMFLVFCNASFWVMECLVFWNDLMTDMHFEVYGSVVWPIIMRILIPCLGFYRIHSAATLLEAWKALNVRLH